MSNRSNLQKLLPASALGLGIYFLDLNSAQAFFPPLPTGSETPVTVTPPTPPVIIPVNPVIPPRPEPTVPPFVPPVVVPIPVVPPPIFVPPPPPPPTIVVPVVVPPDCGCPVTPQTVPEPMTILSGLFGAMTVGGYVFSRRLTPKKN